MQITKRWLCAGAIAVAIGVVPARVGAQNTADVDGGRRLFQGMCVECHGAGGTGGDAPSLNRPRLSHAPDDTALASVIANGIPNTAMPRIRRFTESELRQLVAYVRSVGKAATGSRSGRREERAPPSTRISPARHATSSPARAATSVRISPTSDSMRGAAYLREAVVAPGSSLPKGTLSVLSRGYAEYLPVRIVTRQGSEVRGIRVNEDAFTIQVRDAAGRFYSLRKSDLELLDKQAGKSMMPSFASRLTAPELTDLVAYLVEPAGG